MKRLLALLVILTGYTTPHRLPVPLCLRAIPLSALPVKILPMPFRALPTRRCWRKPRYPLPVCTANGCLCWKPSAIILAAIALPCSSGGLGFSIHYFGGANFNTSQLGLGYGRKLSDKAAIGAQINYNSMQVPGYGSAGTVNFELGTLWHIGEKWHLGIHVYNPTGGRFGKQGAEKLASVYTVGVGYEASDKFFIGTDLNKEEDQPADLSLGMQYVLAKQLLARAGISTSGSNYFFGLGIKLENVPGGCRHRLAPALGFTPGLLLLFDLKEKKETPTE